jgi:hypothetical protein
MTRLNGSTQTNPHTERQTMSGKTNTLKVRRIDLLEALEERYVQMTKHKEAYEKVNDAYNIACTKYEKDVKAYEKRMDDFLRGCAVGGEVNWTGSSRRWSDDEYYYRVISEVHVKHKDVIKAIGPEPKRPESTLTPSFLRSRTGRGYSVEPSVYESVYQAIQLLHMSDDETVSAATYQAALEVL